MVARCSHQAVTKHATIITFLSHFLREDTSLEYPYQGGWRSATRVGKTLLFRFTGGMDAACLPLEVRSRVKTSRNVHITSISKQGHVYQEEDSFAETMASGEEAQKTISY